MFGTIFIFLKKFIFFGNKIIYSVSNKTVRGKPADEQVEILF